MQVVSGGGGSGRAAAIASSRPMDPVNGARRGVADEVQNWNNAHVWAPSEPMLPAICGARARRGDESAPPVLWVVNGSVGHVVAAIGRWNGGGGRHRPRVCRDRRRPAVDVRSHLYWNRTDDLRITRRLSPSTAVRWITPAQHAGVFTPRSSPRSSSVVSSKSVSKIHGCRRAAVTASMLYQVGRVKAPRPSTFGGSSRRPTSRPEVRRLRPSAWNERSKQTRPTQSQLKTCSARSPATQMLPGPTGRSGTAAFYSQSQCGRTLTGRPPALSTRALSPTSADVRPRRSRCHPLGHSGVRDRGHLPGLFHPPRGRPGEDGGLS